MAAKVGSRMEGDELVITLEGNIDSGNSARIEEDIAAVRKANPASSFYVDAEKLNYISSAGLRILLRLRKEQKHLKIINVSPEVYEILETTGFSELLEVQKAYRVISVKGCKVIGKGANGAVYRIDRDTIVKVYHNPDSLPEIHRERELARTAFILGIPTAIPYDVVRIEGGGYGSVFELLNSTSLSDLLSSGEKTVDEVAQMSMDLLRLIHSTEVAPDAVPNMKNVVVNWVEFLAPYLPKPLHQKLTKLVQEVPEVDTMLHGDFHIKNVMLQNGECLLIDMDTICHGHPVFELGSIYNAYQGFSSLDHNVVKEFLGISYETGKELWRKSLAIYLETEDQKKLDDVEAKAQVIGYTRLLRRSIRRDGLNDPKEKLFIQYCQDTLAKLLPALDTLTF